MNVHNRFVTVAVADRIPRETQIAMWDMYDLTSVERAPAQTFELIALNDGRQLIEQTQKNPDFEKEVAVWLPCQQVAERVVIYDDGLHTIMMLGEELNYA